MDDFFTFLGFLQIELLLFCAFWFLIGALDDALVDLFWLVRKAYRKARYYQATPAYDCY